MWRKQLLIFLLNVAEFSKGRTLSFKRQLETYILYLIELVLNPVFDICKMISIYDNSYVN